MAYSSGGLIQASDYNSLATTLNSELNVGTGNRGLGQSAVSGVGAGNSVTAAQWTTLIQRANSALAHKGQAQISPSSVTAGNLATYYASVQTGVNAAYNNPGATGIALSDSAAYNCTYTGTWGTTAQANRAVWLRHVITFASGDAARYFFNAGGRLKWSFSRSGGSATSRNAEWSALATSCGSVQMTANDYVRVGGSGNLQNLQHTGYHGLTTTNVQVFLENDNVGTYSNNWIDLQAYWGGSLSNGGYNTIVVHSVWQNLWLNGFQDYVDGSTTSSLVIGYPSTSYLGNSWGTPSVDLNAWIG